MPDVKRLIACLAWLLIGAAPPQAPCAQPSPVYCRIGEPADIRLDEGVVTARRTVRVAPAALPLERPLTVTIAALASAEVLWNGRVVGRNGIPAEDRASEVPGRYFYTVDVPPRLVRAGDNVVEVRLSGRHLWLPVMRPVHILSIGPYETPELPGRSAYLPALLALGAIAGAFIYFAAGAFAGGQRGALLLAGIAATAMLQLLAEVSRAFISLSYPWALARVTAIAVVAAATAVMLAAYAAQRFAPRRKTAAVAAVAFAGAASVVLIPAFDFKALGAILAGLISLAASAGAAVRRGAWTARAAAAFAAAAMALMVWESTAFLDQGYYLVVAAGLVALVAEQVQILRRAREERDSETRRASALAERLARAEREGEPILALRDGSRTRRVAESDLLYVRAADDYCEAVLTGGQTVLVTMTLVRFLETLPPRFVRVHKSFAVNRAHVAAIAPRAGGGRELRMSDGMSVPIGRSYAAAALAGIS